MCQNFFEAYKTPSRWQRLACAIYEAVLLFGIVFMAGYIFDVITQSRHALMHRHARQIMLFLIIGTYFVWSWSAGRQTLPMKTWHLYLLERSGQPVRPWRAACRYVLSWPLVLTGLGWLWSFVDRDKQFLQDRLAGTRLTIRYPSDSKR
ncbi:MAG: RDD family protein [Burkholderiaceae bacterium]|jgi:uncharacterized RDD family membrane protein YckC